MTIGSIMLGVALLLVVVLYVARPLLTAEPAPISSADNLRQLEQQKEALLIEIKGLDFDHETGKIPPDVYEQQRAQLLSEAAAVLMAMDELGVDSDEARRKQIEASIAQRRHQYAPASTGSAIDSSAGTGQGGFCPNCGRHLDQGDKFCAKCGQAIRAVQPTI